MLPARFAAGRATLQSANRVPIPCQTRPGTLYAQLSMRIWLGPAAVLWFSHPVLLGYLRTAEGTRYGLVETADKLSEETWYWTGSSPAIRR